MKGRLFFTVLFGFLCFHSQSESKLKFVKEYAYFGKIKETDTNVEILVQYTNLGDSPLYIDEIKSHCPCLKSEFSRDALLPGDTTTLTLYYTPFHLGEVFQSITVYYNSDSDSEDRPNQNYRVIGEVVKQSKVTD